MIHPSAIEHNQVLYDLSHLTQRFCEFSWKDKQLEEHTYSVRLRFNDHCYSEEIKDGRILLPNDTVVSSQPLRVFCPIRHRETPTLIDMMEGLITKPGSTIALTARTKGGTKNWKIFRLYPKSDEFGRERYTVFFSIRRGFDGLLDGARGVDVFVESAYLKDATVPVIKNVPFGSAVDMTWCRQRYF